MLTHSPSPRTEGGSGHSSSSSSRRSSSYLLSLDTAGWACLWDEGSTACVACNQVAALPPGAHVTALALVSG